MASLTKPVSSDELSKLPRKIIDAYVLIKKYMLSSTLSGNSSISSLPWKGGISSYQFYSELKKSFLNTAKVSAIQYNSPGYIELALENSIASLVKENTEIYINNKKDLNALFAKLTKYLADEGLNKGDTVPSLTQDQTDKLDALVKELLIKFKQPSWDWVKASTPDMFRATKLAMSYYRRISGIAKFVTEDRAVLAKF